MPQVASILSNLAVRFSTQIQIDKLQSFYGKNADSFNGLQTIPNAIKEAQFNLNWATKHVPDIVAYLDAVGSSSSIRFSLLLLVLSSLTLLF